MVYHGETSISSFIDYDVSPETTYEHALTAWYHRPFPFLGQRSRTVTLIVATPVFWWDNGDSTPPGCALALSPNPLNTSGGHEIVEVSIEPAGPAYTLSLEGSDEFPNEEVLGFYAFDPNPAIGGLGILEFSSISDSIPFPTADFTVRSVSGGIECTAVLTVNFE